jgi:hypothetical protein
MKDSLIKYNILYIIFFICLTYRIIKTKHKNRYVLLFLSLIFFYKPLKIVFGTIHNVYKTCRNPTLYKVLAHNILLNLDIKISHNFEKLPNKPSILLLNYPDDIFEYFINGIFPVKSQYIIAKIAKPYMNLVVKDDHIIYVKDKNNFDHVSSEIKNKIKNFYIICYIEKSEKSIFGRGRIKKGVFEIAKKINAQITPICIDKLTHSYGMNNSTKFFIHVGDTEYVKNPLISRNNVKNFFKTRLKKFERNKFSI